MTDLKFYEKERRRFFKESNLFFNRDEIEKIYVELCHHYNIKNLRTKYINKDYSLTSGYMKAIKIKKHAKIMNITLIDETSYIITINLRKKNQSSALTIVHEFAHVLQDAKLHKVRHDSTLTIFIENILEYLWKNDFFSQKDLSMYKEKESNLIDRIMTHCIDLNWVDVK